MEMKKLALRVVVQTVRSLLKELPLEIRVLMTGLK